MKGNPAEKSLLSRPGPTWYYYHSSNPFRIHANNFTSSSFAKHSRHVSPTAHSFGYSLKHGYGPVTLHKTSNKCVEHNVEASRLLNLIVAVKGHCGKPANQPINQPPCLPLPQSSDDDQILMTSELPLIGRETACCSLKNGGKGSTKISLLTSRYSCNPPSCSKIHPIFPSKPRNEFANARSQTPPTRPEMSALLAFDC